MSVNPFRCCLWCNKEIEHDRRFDANFCRFNEDGLKANCADKFKYGITSERYHAAKESNLLKPIRGWVAKTPQAARLSTRRADNNTFHKCQLGEFNDSRGAPLCDAMFMGPPNKKFCKEEHQVRYNSIKKQNRKAEARISAASGPLQNGGNSNGPGGPR